MTEPRWYYNLNGNITDGKTIFETHTIPKKDIDELFYNEIHKGSNSLLDLLNELSEENEQLKQQLDNVDDCLTRDDMVMLRAERGFE